MGAALKEGSNRAITFSQHSNHIISDCSYILNLHIWQQHSIEIIGELMFAKLLQFYVNVHFTRSLGIMAHHTEYQQHDRHQPNSDSYQLKALMNSKLKLIDAKIYIYAFHANYQILFAMFAEFRD